jgi:hypothetical protein
MSRKEIVLMVSRAIALLLFIPSLINFVLSILVLITNSYIRDSVFNSLGSQASSSMFRVYGLTFLEGLLNVGIHLSVALFFWQCGPRIERMLLPAGIEQPGSAA